VALGPFKVLANPTGAEEIYKIYAGWVARHFYRRLAELVDNPEDFIILGTDVMFLHLTPDIVRVDKGAGGELVRAVEEYVRSEEYQAVKRLTRFNEPLSAYYTWNFMIRLIELLKEERQITQEDVLEAMLQAATAVSAAEDIDLPEPLDDVNGRYKLGN
jgi:hypothetical protein